MEAGQMREGGDTVEKRKSETLTVVPFVVKGKETV